MPQARYPDPRFDHAVPATLQRFHVLARGRVPPHVDVHRRRQQHRAGEGQVQGGEKIAGQPVGQLGQQIGGGGRHRQQIVFLRRADVVDRVFDGEQVGQHLAAGERRERHRRHEPLRGLGHHRSHLVALLHQQTRQLGRLVRRDAAADAENDLHGKLSPRHQPLPMVAAPMPVQSRDRRKRLP